MSTRQKINSHAFYTTFFGRCDLRILPACLFIILGWVFGALDMTGVAISFAFVVICFPNALVRRFNLLDRWRLFFSINRIVLIVIIGLALMLHELPGFYNLLIWQDRLLSHDAIPHTFYINFDKVLIAIVLLPLLLFRTQNTNKNVKVAHANTSEKNWSSSLCLMIFALTLFATFSVAYTLGAIEIDFKWPAQSILFLVTMLFITVTAEECLFRGIMQRSLSDRFGLPAVIFISGILFGAAHIPFSVEFAFAAVFAGLGYGYIYYKSESILWPIALHMLLNLIHYTCFTYPIKLV